MTKEYIVVVDNKVVEWLYGEPTTEDILKLRNRYGRFKIYEEWFL